MNSVLRHLVKPNFVDHFEDVDVIILGLNVVFCLECFFDVFLFGKKNILHPRQKMTSQLYLK